MLFRRITDPHLAQNAYLIGCQRSGGALIIDPQRDVDRYVELARAEGLEIVAATETHIHADYLSGVRELAARGVKVYLSDEGGDDWRYRWASDEDIDSELLLDIDSELLLDGDSFRVGNIEFQARHTPGHTPEHLSFLVIDHGSGVDEPMGLASGDFVFVGDLGRPDLLETAAGEVGARDPSARALYRSVQDFLELPDFLQLWPGHGAGSACGKALGAVPTSTVGYEKRFNASIADARVSEQAFVDAILHGQPEPPTYFARMKQLNRSGPPILGELPEPRHLSINDLEGILEDPDAVVVDTRLDRTAFMNGHLPGALYAPLGKSFPTITGSYILPEQKIILILDADRVDEAVRDLIRIGLDQVVGYFTPNILEGYVGYGHELQQIEILNFEAASQLDQVAGGPGDRNGDRNLALDVRSITEYETRHLPGALNIAHTRLAARADELPTDRRLLVYCRTGARASYAAAYLQRAGYDVAYIDDTIEKWS